MSDIAINPVTRRVQFTGNTGTGPFAFTFNILVDGDIAVYKGGTLLTLTADYTVSINANGTGSITLGVALIATDVLTIIGGRQLARTTDFVTAGDLLASSLNEQLDSNVIMTQQLDEKFDRALALGPGDTFNSLILPLKDDRKGTVLGFNLTTGDPEAGPTLSTFDTVSAISADIKTLAEIQDGTVATDAITNVNTVRADVTTVAGQTANMQNVTDNLTEIQNASANAATAATSATAAAGSATTATTQAGISTTKAGEASTSATTAQTAKTAAETALDEFTDIYLGSKSSAPTTDNDGNALVTGAIYWNSTQNQLYVWDGSAWDPAAFTTSGAVTSFNSRTGAVTLTSVDITNGSGLLTTGGAMTGPITTNSTFDGVDIAARDAVLTSTTTTANSATTTANAAATTANAALPKAGGALTGAVTTNSTFDGVDIAARDAVLTSTTATANNGSAKAWGFVIGSGTAAIQDSNNLSSITDNGTGNYTISYTNGMANTNYAYQLTVAQLRLSPAGSNFRVHGYPAIATGSITFTTGFVSSVGGTFNVADVGDINLMLNGDLA